MSKRDETDVRSLRQTSQSGARTHTMNDFNNQCWPEVRNTKTLSEAAVDVSRTWVWGNRNILIRQRDGEDGDALWLTRCLSLEETAALIKMQSNESRRGAGESQLRFPVCEAADCDLMKRWRFWLQSSCREENLFLPSFYCRCRITVTCPRLSALKWRK